MNIIIPIYILNEELNTLTKNAIESLKGELILIDNASLPESKPFLKEKAAVYIENEENLGFPKAVNQGFKKSVSDLITVANNDIRVSPNWESVAKEIFNENPKVGSVHFRMIPYEEPFNLGFDTWITGKERWCHGSFYVIRREAIPEGGYFEGYGMGGYDDYDFFHRMRDLNGWKQAYTNRAQFQHKDSSTLSALDQTDRAERDRRNKEMYKERFGEYPDIQFAKLFPEQMNEPWKPFP